MNECTFTGRQVMELVDVYRELVRQGLRGLTA